MIFVILIRRGALRSGRPHCPRLAGGPRGASGGGECWGEESILSHRDGSKLRGGQCRLRQWKNVGPATKLLLPTSHRAEGTTQEEIRIQRAPGRLQVWQVEQMKHVRVNNWPHICNICRPLSLNFDLGRWTDPPASTGKRKARIQCSLDLDFVRTEFGATELCLFGVVKKFYCSISPSRGSVFFAFIIASGINKESTEE